MVATIIVLGIAVVILLFLLCLQHKEIKETTARLQNMSCDSNELLHSSGGQKHMRKLICEINALLTRLRQLEIDYRTKNRNREQMITNIAHDLRTPLTSAIGYINMIGSSDLSDEEKEQDLQVVEKRLYRLEELIDSFFDFSKVMSGEYKPESQVLNIVAVLEEAIAHHYDDFNSQGRAIQLNCPETKLSVYANPNMLMRIFDNLIGNAYNHGSGNLIISVMTSDQIVLRFENSIIDPDLDPDLVFDEFYTTDISRTKGHSGLGLSIVKQYWEILGGSVSATYKNNIFAITLLMDAKKTA